jgi:DNA-binding transcriptional regulator/RsmH inhibitor MraZ
MLFREELAGMNEDRLILFVLGRCVAAFPANWAAATMATSGDDADAAFLKSKVPQGRECRLDRVGRVTIPRPLREAASLEGQVILLGCNSRFELWNKDVWASTIPDTDSQL